MSATFIQRVRHQLLTVYKRRSAWGRGVNAYALDMLEALEAENVNTTRITRTTLLNGADNEQQYSEGGCALIYDGDIAARLCTPSELARKHNGALPPNRSETWLDTQARAIAQAIRRIVRCAKAIDRRDNRA